MSITQLHVTTNPASPEHLAAYHRWYDDIHIPQVIERIDGVVSARRFSLSEAQVAPSDALPVQRFLAVYDIEDDHPQGVLDRLIAGLGDGTLDMSEALDGSIAPTMVVWSPHG